MASTEKVAVMLMLHGRREEPSARAGTARGEREEERASELKSVGQRELDVPVRARIGVRHPQRGRWDRSCRREPRLQPPAFGQRMRSV